MGLIDDLGGGPIGLDTAVFIYFVEEHEEFLPLVEPLFVGLDDGRWSGVTSSLTLLETLVVPYRAGDTALAERYEALLSRSRGLRLVELDRPLLRAAAHLRAALSVKTPDAIQLAAALGARCTAFVTNHRELPAIPGLPILRLGDYLASNRRSRRRLAEQSPDCHVVEQRAAACRCSPAVSVCGQNSPPDDRPRQARGDRRYAQAARSAAPMASAHPYQSAR